VEQDRAILHVAHVLKAPQQMVEVIAPSIGPT